jgi:restriction endonuclease
VKLRFEPDLDYQRHAIDAVCDLFRGQETCRTEFTVSLATSNGQLPLGVIQSDLGVGNALGLPHDALLTNLRAVQLRNGLAPSESLDSADFTVEMETGTGKTYVYLRTIFELNKRYGFTKFVIVVPSIAIKEGVKKTLEMTEEHFKAIYAGTPTEYFLYDSAKLGQVRNFATGASVQIMVVTVGAINKKTSTTSTRKARGPATNVPSTSSVRLTRSSSSTSRRAWTAASAARGKLRSRQCIRCARFATRRRTSMSTTWCTASTPSTRMSANW